jgi:hypothetical protein
MARYAAIFGRPSEFSNASADSHITIKRRFLAKLWNGVDHSTQRASGTDKRRGAPGFDKFFCNQIERYLSATIASMKVG